MSQHGLGLKKEEKKENIDLVFNSSAVLFRKQDLVAFLTTTTTTGINKN
jgi:hypothetical protein